MRKIRIGNDIRLKLRIEPNTQAGFDKIDEFDQSSVKQLKCYLINTSYFRPSKEVGPKPFLKVGFPEFYRPSKCNINNAGFPSYHMRPANLCNYDRFEPDFHDFHWWPGYRGFGLHPEHFHDHCPHLWHGPKPKPSCCGFNCACDPHIEHTHVPACEQPYFPENEPYDIYGCPVADHSHQNPLMPYYLADSQVLNEKNTLTCLFPAVQQKLCGTYKLVVVMTVFEQGWGRHNLRTYTIDKGDVFELVDDETGESGAVTIDTEDNEFASGKRENVYKSIYTDLELYTIASGTITKIGSSDAGGVDYNIYAVLKDGSTVIYNPYDWHFTELKFTSSNPDVVSVDKYGTLTAHEIDSLKKEVIITVSDIDNNIEYQFTVIVKYMDSIKIGFNLADDIDQMSANNVSMLNYRVKDGKYSVPNPENGRYLWIFSQRRIQYIKSVEDNDEIAAELSSGFRVPMTNAVIKDGYFCYRSAAPILAGNMNIKIKFA